jgi:hypothetical protein
MDPVVSKTAGWVDSRLQQDMVYFMIFFRNVLFGMVAPGVQLLVLIPEGFRMSWLPCATLLVLTFVEIVLALAAASIGAPAIHARAGE